MSDAAIYQNAFPWIMISKLLPETRNLKVFNHWRIYNVIFFWRDESSKENLDRGPEIKLIEFLQIFFGGLRFAIYAKKSLRNYKQCTTIFLLSLKIWTHFSKKQGGERICLLWLCYCIWQKTYLLKICGSWRIFSLNESTYVIVSEAPIQPSNPLKLPSFIFEEDSCHFFDIRKFILQSQNIIIIYIFMCMYIVA